MTNPISPLMTPNALAARLGITPGILARWRVQGRGPRFIRVGGRVRYRGGGRKDLAGRARKKIDRHLAPLPVTRAAAAGWIDEIQGALEDARVFRALLAAGRARRPRVLGAPGMLKEFVHSATPRSDAVPDADSFVAAVAAAFDRRNDAKVAEPLYVPNGATIPAAPLPLERAGRAGRRSAAPGAGVRRVHARDRMTACWCAAALEARANDFENQGLLRAANKDRSALRRNCSPRTPRGASRDGATAGSRGASRRGPSESVRDRGRQRHDAGHGRRVRGA